MYLMFAGRAFFLVQHHAKKCYRIVFKRIYSSWKKLKIVKFWGQTLEDKSKFLKGSEMGVSNP